LNEDNDEAGAATPLDNKENNRVDNQKIKVLAVDDDTLILMNTAVLLEDMGHTVLEARNGVAALEMLQLHADIGLLITDQTMPNMTGIELIALISVSRPGLPIILATGYGDMAADAGDHVVMLNKPFNESDLSRAMARALGMSAD